MAGWFDDYAKRASQRTRDHKRPSEGRGLSRRQVIRGGAVVAGAAWAAPTLFSSPAYAYGVSNCPSNRICGASNELQFCCPGAVDGSGSYTCTKDANGGNGCAQQGFPGGTCTNNGTGTSGCQGNAALNVHCNGNASGNSYCNCNKPNICGGYGAQCASAGTTECSPGFTCYNNRYCAPQCSPTNPCPTNLVQNGKALTCSSGVCRQSCTGSGDCPQAGNTCSGGFCS